MPDRPGDMDERDVDARFASIVAQWEHSAVDESDAVAPAGAPVTDDSPADPAAGPESAAGGGLSAILSREGPRRERFPRGESCPVSLDGLEVSTVASPFA